MHGPALHSILRAIDPVDNFLAVFLAAREGISAHRLRTDAGFNPRLDASLYGRSASTRKPACSRGACVLAIICIPHFGHDGRCVVLGMAVHTPTISRALPPSYGGDISRAN
jgi:hypothetical protein